MLIRCHQTQDWPGVWKILRPVFRDGETYAFPIDITEEQARCAWTENPKTTFVVEDPQSGHLLGTYYLTPNHAGPGSHVCNCGYVVSVAARSRGIATTMCEHSLKEALSRGYRAMQFNLVAASNQGAVRLWKKMGFNIIGTIPDGFRHPRLGWVDAYVMYQQLGSSTDSS